MKTRALYLRSVIFGITDSLASTVGFLAGIGAAGVPQRIIVLTGVTYAIVEAFSMAVGDYLSEESSEEYSARGRVPEMPSILAGIAMFFACVFAAMIPLSPYVFIEGPSALPVSVGVSVLALFIAGLVSARFSRRPLLWRGARMALLGGAAIAIGIAVGTLMPAV